MAAVASIDSASAWLSKRLAALETFKSEEDGLEGTTCSSRKTSQFDETEREEDDEVLEVRPEDFEIKEEDLVEFSTDGILTDINLAGTTPDEELGNAGFQALSLSLANKVGNLRRLSLRRCGLSGSAGFREVGRLLTRCCSLEVLDVSNNDAGEGLRGEFCEALDDARSLRVLEMRGCGLRDRGLDPLCAVLERVDEALRPVVAVQKLSLSTNHITPEGARRLGSMLSTNLKLEDLDISDNDLQEAGGESIAEGLVGNKGRLQKLNISHNRLRVGGARAVLDRFLETDSMIQMHIKRLPGTKHGFVLDGMTVTGLEFMGWVEKHNEKHPSEAVFAGDRIVDVNGKTEDGDMIYELTVGEDLDIKLARDGVCMKNLDICYNLLGTKGSEELMKLIGSRRKGSMLGNQARLPGGRIVLLNAY